MLSPEELKPYLLHEDKPVRNAVVEYFADRRHQDEEIVPMILQAYDRWGEEENISGLHACRRFPITEQAFLDLVARSSSMAETDSCVAVCMPEICVVFQSVKLSVPWSYSPIAARGSIALGTSRLFTMSSLVTCLAPRNAASAALASPICH